jgi:hypothetical protein
MARRRFVTVTVVSRDSSVDVADIRVCLLWTLDSPVLICTCTEQVVKLALHVVHAMHNQVSTVNSVELQGVTPLTRSGEKREAEARLKHFNLRLFPPTPVCCTCMGG